MNKYGVLYGTPLKYQRSKNIGDYIQSIASSQYYPYVNYVVNREEIDMFMTEDVEKCKVIMNAWYMSQPEHWPPSSCLEPLPISMHISPNGSNGMLKSDGLHWFKVHQPIGCRDLDTKKILEEKGVSCYYSNCLTLTLNRTYRPQDERKGVVFVDPFIPIEKTISEAVHVLIYAIMHPICVLKLSRHSMFKMSWNSARTRFGTLRGIYKAAKFHLLYSTLFGSDLLMNAEYITHMVDVTNEKSDEVLMQIADSLLKRYTSLKLLVTSRIHAALPCLSFNTPVIFIDTPELQSTSKNGNRLNGMLELFNVVNIKGNSLEKTDDIVISGGKITEKSEISNKTTWVKFANELEKKCLEFVNCTSAQ